MLMVHYAALIASEVGRFQCFVGAKRGGICASGLLVKAAALRGSRRMIAWSLLTFVHREK
jgi:hypothetical protein